MESHDDGNFCLGMCDFSECGDERGDFALGRDFSLWRVESCAGGIFASEGGDFDKRWIFACGVKEEKLGEVLFLRRIFGRAKKEEIFAWGNFWFVADLKVL